MIDWNQIETVFLDMDGTLLDLHYDNHFWRCHLPERYAAQKGISVEQAIILLTNIYLAHADTLNWYCIDFWSDQLGMDVGALKHETANRIAWRPNAQKFLGFVRDQGYDIALVTNAHRKSIDVKLKHTGLDQTISEIISSHDLKLPKEDVEFWHRLQRQRHFNPERTAFFDDNENVLRSAQRFGIRHLFTIAQPDSAQEKRLSSEFPLIHDFQDLLP